MDDLAEKCTDELDIPTIRYEERYKRIILKYLEEAYERGKERGRELEGNYWNP
jgi:hypothetical protein